MQTNTTHESSSSSNHPIINRLPVALLEPTDDLVRDPLALDGAQERAGVQPVVMHATHDTCPTGNAMDRITFGTPMYTSSIYQVCDAPVVQVGDNVLPDQKARGQPPRGPGAAAPSATAAAARGGTLLCVCICVYNLYVCVNVCY